MLGSHLKKVFSSDTGVEPSPQVLDILEHACRRFIRSRRIPSTGGAGWVSASRFCPADLRRKIPTENSGFEIASQKSISDRFIAGFAGPDPDDLLGR
jgi:hypothetical protein